MLFQVLCGFEPIFYTTHPNEESIFLTNTIPDVINIINITKKFYEYADVEIDLESSDCKEKTYVSNIVALGAGTIKIL